MRMVEHRRAGTPPTRRAALVTTIAVALYATLRIPSFFEPHWYTDEAGYVTTARQLLRGELLYSQIWSNKPPLQLWTVATTIRLLGSGEAALHTLTFATGFLTLCAVAFAASRLLNFRWAVVAVVASAILIGSPLLDAELLVPESILIAPTAWAGAILLVRLGQGRTDGRVWPLAVGALAALAVAYQQTAAADAAAFFLILLVSPMVRLRQAALFLAAFVTATAMWLIPTLVLAGPSRVAYALAGFYVPYTTYQVHGDQSLMIRFGAAIAITVLLAIGGALGARRAGWSWAALLWSVATLLAAAAPLHPYPHLALPAVVPTLMVACVSLENAGGYLRLPSRWRLSAATLGASGLIALSLASVTGMDWVPALASQGTNNGRTLNSYYGGFVGAVASTGSPNFWRSDFSEQVDADRAVADWVQANGFAGSRAVVWSSDAWLYMLADLDDVMPTPPIYNNFVLLGDQGEVTSYVASQMPALIITADPDLESFPEISTLLTRSYVEVFSAGPDRVWVPYSPSHRLLARPFTVPQRSP